MCKTRVSFLLILTSVIILSVSVASAYVPSIEVETVLIESGPFAEVTRLVGSVVYSDEQLCFFPFAGKIAQICVTPGQQVKKGDLLFRLDTTDAERALAVLAGQEYLQQSLMKDVQAAFSSFALTQLYDAQQLRQKLLGQIAGAQLRAEIDGIVEEIYFRQGQMIDTTGPVGRIVSSDRQIRVVNQSLKVQKDTPALIYYDKQNKGTAYFVKDEIAFENMTQIRNLTFAPADPCLIGLDPQEKVELALMDGEYSETTLIPLEAVGIDNQIWIVENDRARAVEIDISRRNESYIAAEEKWQGKRVILLPEMYDLSNGCLVREKN